MALAICDGDYILTENVSVSLLAENAYLYNLDGTQQAMSLTIPSLANGLSGKLQSGDIISIIASDFRRTGETVIPPELKYVEVISVTTKTGEDSNLQYLNFCQNVKMSLWHCLPQ